MNQLAPDLWQLDGRPADMINVYLVGDVLVDAGTRYDEERILRQLPGRSIAAHALTHAHPEPPLVCFGHGPALRDTQLFVDYAEGLPTP